MPGKILGLDINDDSIAAVQVASTLKGYQVTACARITVEGDDGLDSALKELFDHTDLKSDVCHTSISPEHVSYRNLRLPFRDTKKIKQTLPFEIEALVPFPIEDVVVDFSVIDRSDKTEVLAASVKKSLISSHLNDLLAHGVEPDIMDINCVPAVAWLLKQEETPDDGLFLQLDGKKNTMVLFQKRHIELVRSFVSNGQPGIAGIPHEPEGTNTDTGHGERTDAYYQTLCIQVQNTIHGFGAQNNKDVHLEKVLFSGTKAVFPETEDWLNRFFDIPAEQVDLSRNEKVSMDTDIARVWNPALMGNALALALRDPKQDQGFNFRKDEFEKKKHYFGSKKEIWKALILFAILLCFLAVDIGVDYYFLKKRYETLDQKITEVFKETFPDVKRIVDPVKQMKVEINKIKTSAVSHPAAGGKNTVLELLKDISKQLPKSLEIRLTRMVIDLESVRISGITDTFNTVDKIKNGLETSGCFSAATISSAKLDRMGNKVEFEIKLERAT